VPPQPKRSFEKHWARGFFITVTPPTLILLTYAAAAQAQLRKALGTGVVDNEHSTYVEPPPPPPRACMSIHPERESCSDLGSCACAQ
jgi:hypothetical protein